MAKKKMSKKQQKFFGGKEKGDKGNMTVGKKTKKGKGKAKKGGMPY